MATRCIPVSLRQAAPPGVKDFALLAGLEASVRATLISAMPLVAYDAFGSAGATSAAYFAVGLLSTLWGLLVPWLNRFVPRRWLFTLGAALYLVSMALAIAGGQVSVGLAILLGAMATATTFVCMNAYVLDYVERAELGRNQSMQMVFAAGPWAVGPVLGVWLRGLWEPLPFLLAGGFACALVATFWVLRLGNGKQIARARRPAANPLAYLGRFFGQPRLIAGWLFAVVRSCGWWVYVVYLPIFCIENGLGESVGGTALSISNALLFLSPVVLRTSRARGVKRTVRMGFGICAAAFLAAALLAPWPWLAVIACMAASTMLILLDVVGGLPFLMAVKPSERTEMAAVYASFRDVSGIATPGGAWLVLLVAPLPGVFATVAVAMAACFLTAGRLHPRLGALRPSRGGA